MLTFTATAQMTFPLDYHSKNDLRPLIMFNVETGKTLFATLKMTFGMQRHLMYSSNIKNMNICCKMLRFICKIYDKSMHNFYGYFQVLFENLLNRFKKSM